MSHEVSKLSQRYCQSVDVCGHKLLLIPHQIRLWQLICLSRRALHCLILNFFWFCHMCDVCDVLLQ